MIIFIWKKNFYLSQKRKEKFKDEKNASIKKNEEFNNETFRNGLLGNINKSMNESSIKNNENILNESRRRLILYERIKRRLNGKDNIELNEEKRFFI